MNSGDARERFNLPLIAFHWLTLVLIALAYAISELAEAFGDTPTENLLQHWHETIGIAVLALTALRLLARAVSRTPAIRPAPPRWQTHAAGAVHVALYGLMIGLPLTGWLMVNADGETVVWFGRALPVLMAPSERWEHRVEDLHEAIASAGYVLIGLHAAAALFHHTLMRDNTLRRMLPTRRSAVRG